VAGRAGSTLGLAAALGGAILTIAYVTRAWNQAFWGRPTDYVIGASRNGVLVSVSVVLAATVVVLGVGFDPLMGAANAAAEAALDLEGYVEAVDPDRFVPTESADSHGGDGE
jgi:multicomponent Na+:H+ antiporter subunit D